MPNRCTNPNDTNHYRIWARRILCCYPRAWRERYEREMEQVLDSHAVTFWTLLDLLVGALDARLHPEIGTALVAVDSAGVLALLALLVGGIPIVYVVLRHALRERQWRLLGLLAVPPLAFMLLFSYTLLAGEASTQRAPHGTPDAPFTTLALILQFAFVLLLLAAVGGSTIAVALAVRRSRLSDRLLRFGLVPAAVVTLGMAGGVVATIILTVLIVGKAPQLQGLFG